MIVPQPTSPPSSDGAIYSPDVEIPKPRPTNWEQIAYRQADELARLRRLLQDQEKRCAWGTWATCGEPFGSYSEDVTSHIRDQEAK